MKLTSIIYKNLVLTSKAKEYITVTNKKCLMLFRETTAVYSEKNTKLIRTFCW
jgi:hypothetical protein